MKSARLAILITSAPPDAKTTFAPDDEDAPSFDAEAWAAWAAAGRTQRSGGADATDVAPTSADASPAAAPGHAHRGGSPSGVPVR